MAATPVKLDTVVYPLFGIAAYWAWSSAVMITSGIWPEGSAGHGQIDWLANATSHCVALAMLSLFMERLSPLVSSKRWEIGCAALISLGTVLVVLGAKTTALPLIAVAGSVSSGIGTAGALLFWASALMAIERADMRHFVLAGSIIVALIGTVLILCLPPLAGSLLCIALPFAIVLCAREDGGPSVDSAPNAAGFDQTEAAAPAAPAVPAVPASPAAPEKRHARIWELASLYLCCFIMALAAGMYQSSSAQSDPGGPIDQWRTLYASVCILVSAAVYLDVRLSTTRLSHLFSRLIVPLIAGGLLIIAVVGDDPNGWGGVPMQTGYHLFLIYIYTQFALLGRTSRLPLSTFARGTVAIDVGLLAGCLFMTFAGDVADDGMRGVILAVVYLLLLIGVLLFPNVIASVTQRSQQRARILIAEQGALDDGAVQQKLAEGGGAGQSGGDQTDALSKPTLHAFAKRLGLSPREQEVLEHLVRGRTLPAIASEAHLSYNTVKTHVSHIYQKAGVHTRDELIDLLEK